MVYSNAPSHSGVVTISSSTAAINSCIVYSTVFCNAIYFAASSSSQVQFCNFFAPGGVAFRYQGDNPSHGPPAIGLIALTNANGDSCDTYYNLFMDPQFADTANGDYHLLAGSPCIDAGDPELSNDPDGTIADIGAFYYNQAGTADDVRTAVRHYELLQNYPNPFNNTTEIVFDLPRNEFVELSVYDIGGRRVMTLLAERMAAGRHAVNVDASALPSGVYLYQLRGEGFSETRKMVLIK